MVLSEALALHIGQTRRRKAVVPVASDAARLRNARIGYAPVKKKPCATCIIAIALTFLSFFYFVFCLSLLSSEGSRFSYLVPESTGRLRNTSPRLGRPVGVRAPSTGKIRTSVSKLQPHSQPQPQQRLKPQPEPEPEPQSEPQTEPKPIKATLFKPVEANISAAEPIAESENADNENYPAAAAVLPPSLALIAAHALGVHKKDYEANFAAQDLIQAAHEKKQKELDKIYFMDKMKEKAAEMALLYRTSHAKSINTTDIKEEGDDEEEHILIEQEEKEENEKVLIEHDEDEGEIEAVQIEHEEDEEEIEEEIEEEVLDDESGAEEEDEEGDDRKEDEETDEEGGDSKEHEDIDEEGDDSEDDEYSEDWWYEEQGQPEIEGPELTDFLTLGRHPHVGALDESGAEGYVHDAGMLQRAPPKFSYNSELEDLREHGDARHNANVGAAGSPVCGFSWKDDNEGNPSDKLGREHIGWEGYRLLNEQVVVQSSVGPSPRILCTIYTISTEHIKLNAIRQTWGPKCDGFMAASNATDRELGAVSIPHWGEESYRGVWQKVRSIWAYIHKTYIDDYDFFYIGGDDYYLLVDNLRRYLTSDEILKKHGGEGWPDPLYLGHRIFEIVGETQSNHGGSGYVLNRAALRVLVEKAFMLDECMPYRWKHSEDKYVGACLRKFGILPRDTCDKNGLQRFNIFTPRMHAAGTLQGYSFWYKNTAQRKKWKFGLDSVSPQSVAFHYVSPNLMKQIHAVLYNLCKGHEVIVETPPKASESESESED